MHINRRSILICGLITLIVTCGGNADARRRIEAVKGKQYRLTKKHGPWMIMVASLSEPPPERKIDGMTPQEAADQLVFQLRRKGIPAYTYQQSELKQSINTFDRRGRGERRLDTARENRVCVIAGNYPSINDRIAQKTLSFVKTIRPKTWEKSGIYKSSPGRPGPLSGAFMSINPMLSPEDVAQRKNDPLLRRLNSRQRFSLLQNRGNYSLTVASFTGSMSTSSGTFSNVRRALQQDDGGRKRSTLDDFAENAVDLAKALRSGNYLVVDVAQTRPPDHIVTYPGTKLDAFVLHEKYKSIVTVGSFDQQNDSQIRSHFENFRAKQVRSRNGQVVSSPQYIMVPDKKDPNNKFKMATFVFDPKPQLVKVPKLR